MPGQIIDTVRIYKFNIFAKKQFSFGTWHNRQHLFLKLGSEGKTGWAECVMSTNKPDINLFDAASCFEQLRGKSVSEAFTIIRSVFGAWKYIFTETAEMALIDLRGKLTKKSAVDLLVLENRNPVPGIYVILSKDADEVHEKTAIALASNRDSVIKMKLFGDVELDRKLISAVRSLALRERTILIGDVNYGYSDALDFSMEKLGIQLIMLHTAGLDACEDPAEMPIFNWVRLQEFVSPLKLIADSPLRPSRKAQKIIRRDMCEIFNIHPDAAGSIFDAVILGEKIKGESGSLMIGDDSLIGPGCSAWQQLAIGLGADFVEATEKDVESDFYREALYHDGIDYRDGFYYLRKDAHGFGVELDEDVLSFHAAQILDL